MCFTSSTWNYGTYHNASKSQHFHFNKLRPVLVHDRSPLQIPQSSAFCPSEALLLLLYGERRYGKQFLRETSRCPKRVLPVVPTHLRSAHPQPGLLIGCRPLPVKCHAWWVGIPLAAAICPPSLGGVPYPLGLPVRAASCHAIQGYSAHFVFVFLPSLPRREVPCRHG